MQNSQLVLHATPSGVQVARECGFVAVASVDVEPLEDLILVDDLPAFALAGEQQLSQDQKLGRILAFALFLIALRCSL